MKIITIKRLFFAGLGAGFLMLASCDPAPKKWRTPNMMPLTPPLHTMFDKSKIVCFGRFMVDVPESATIVWGETDVPLFAEIYPGNVDEVKVSAQEFIDKLKGEKAIYHDDVPLLLSVENVIQPEGKIVVGYEGFEAINEIKINGYFRLNEDGVILNTHSFKDEKEKTVELIKNFVKRLRKRAEDEVPAEPGNCIEHAFLPDESGVSKEASGELVSIGFRLKEYPDAHLSIQIGPSNPHNPERDSLKAQWKRIKEDPATPEEQKALANTKFFRESPREIHDWKTGYEVLTRSPDEDGSHSHHDFQVKFTGVPYDPYKPYADIQFQTGVADNAAGATKASLTDEEAIAIWDKITSTIRVRPTSATPIKAAGAGPRPNVPLGELAATGRICPQTGWWQPNESHERDNSQRQHIKTGERMPHMVSVSEPSLWQKIKGERAVYQTATVWKLVSYDDAPSHADVGNRMEATTHASSAGAIVNDSTNGPDAVVRGENTSHQNRS